MKRQLKSIFSSLIILLLSACDSTTDPDKLYFIGDSIIAGWDTAQDFPSFMTENLGKGGSELNYIESFAGKMKNKDVVVISGTNYIPSHPSEIESFALSYLKAIENLGARHIYLFSIIPRNTTEEPNPINLQIKDCNTIVQHTISTQPVYDNITYIDVYDNFMKDGKVNRNLFYDRLHPNAEGYEILTQSLLKAIY